MATAVAIPKGVTRCSKPVETHSSHQREAWTCGTAQESYHSARSLNWLRTSGILPNVSPAQRFVGGSHGLAIQLTMAWVGPKTCWAEAVTTVVTNVGRNDRPCRSTAEPADFSINPYPGRQFSQYTYCSHLGIFLLLRVPSGGGSVSY